MNACCSPGTASSFLVQVLPRLMLVRCAESPGAPQVNYLPLDFLCCFEDTEDSLIPVLFFPVFAVTMHKHRNTGGTTFFYQPFKTVTEIRSGYLYKSPPKRLTAEKSWKRRYFVLFKVSDQEHYLKYFKSEADRETLHKEIDLSQISLMYGSPEHHQKWDLIQRTMKCSPSCVLYIRTPNRDYFFVGADSDEVDGWFTDLFEALKNRPHTCMSSEEMRYQEQIAKNISKPNMRKKNSGTECEKQQKSQSLCDLYPYERGATGQAKDFSKRPASEPVNPLYDYPRSYLNQADICENSSTYDQNKESIYVTMVGLIHDNDVAQEA
ncbi:hypothetical protein INR49_013717 [Caranx melampygus]|nr:hypothetical protein INR49_013717 [Caranx melampygus]